MIKNILILKLILFTTSLAIALTNEEQGLLIEHGVTRPTIMLQTDKWGVKPSKIDEDGHIYKGQRQSLINWNLDEQTWLDFNYWKEQRDSRDQQPDWKMKLRQTKHVELIGKFLKCYGSCQLYRGRMMVDANYQSRIEEGDEIITGEDSYAWVVMADGSLLRISPRSSLTLNEINIGAKDIYFFLRLNEGHIHWQVRKIGKFTEQNMAETDLIFHPLMLKEANRENFARKEYQLMSHDQRLLYQIRKNPGHIFQYKKLNSLMEKDKEILTSRNTHVFIVTLNSSYHAKNAHLDLYNELNGKTKFRYYTQLDGFENLDERETKAMAYLRGYENRQEYDLNADQWYMVERTGKLLKQDDFSQQFKTIAMFVKRIPSIHLAREIILRNDYPYLLEKNINTEKMATKYGYRLWNIDGKEFSERLSFLKEYTRRVETTNINSMNKIYKGKEEQDFNSQYFAKALHVQMRKLKNLYNKKRSMIPELSELQYYIWTLKYAKKE